MRTRNILLAGAVLVILCLCAHVWREVRVSLQAEQTHHAYYVVLDVLHVYLRQNSGRWPRGWNDLEKTTPSNQSPIFRWPDDMEEFKNRIHIDFELTGAQVAAMEVESFSAVQPIGPNFGPHEEMIRVLLRAARELARDNLNAYLTILLQIHPLAAATSSSYFLADP